MDRPRDIQVTPSEVTDGIQVRQGDTDGTQVSPSRGTECTQVTPSEGTDCIQVTPSRGTDGTQVSPA